MANKSVSVSESKHNGLKTKTHSEVSCWNCLKIDDPDWDPEPLTLRGIRKHNRHKFRLYPFFASEISKPKALPLSQKVSEHYSIGKKVEEKIVKYAEKKEKNIAKEVTPQVTEKTDSSIDQALPSNVVKGTTSQTENASNKLRPPFIENSTIVKITENKLGAVEVFETQNATENISKRSVNDSSNDIDEIQATSGQKKSDNSDELRAINKNVTEEIVNSVKSNQTLQELNFDDIKNAKNIKFISQNKDLQAIGQIKQTSLDSLTTQLDPVKDVASCENIKEVQRNTSNISENIRSTEIKKIQLQDSVTNNIDHIEPAHIISAIQYHDQSKITVPIEKITQTDYAETDQKFLKKDSTHTREPKSKITTTSYENPVKERVSPNITASSLCLMGGENCKISEDSKNSKIGSDIEETEATQPTSFISLEAVTHPAMEIVPPGDISYIPKGRIDSEKSQNNEDQQKNDLKESALIEKKIQSSPVIDLSPRKLDVKEHQEELKKHGRMDKIDNVEPIFSTSVVPKDKNQDEERCHTNILIRESEKSPEEFVDANTLMTDSVTNIKAAGLDIKEQFKSTSISSMLSLKEHIPIITKNQENKSDFETLNIVKDKEFPMNTSHMDDNSDASENIEIIPFPAIVTSLAPEINPLKDKLVSENITSSINEKLHVGNSKIEQYTNNLPNSSIRKGPETTISSSCFGIVGSQSKPISLKNTLKGKDILCGIESDQVKETEDSSISNKINEDLGENLTNDKTSLIKDTSTQNIPELSIKPKALTKETVTLPSEVKEQHLVKNDQIKGTVSDNIMNDLPLNINKDSLSLNKEIDPTKNIDISEKETEISRENYQINDSPKKGEPESEFTDLTVPPSSVIPEPVSDKPITSTETLKLSTPKPSRLPIKISQASPKLRLEETQDSMENALNNIVSNSLTLATLPKSPRTLIRSDSRDSTKMVNKPEVDTLTPKLLRNESTSAKVIKSPILATLPKSSRTLIRSNSRDSTKMVNKPEVDTLTSEPLKTESTSAKVIKSPTLATLPKSPQTLIRSDSRDSTKMVNKPEVDTLTQKLLRNESTSAKVIESSILGTLPKSPRTLIRSDSRDSTKIVNKPEVDTLTPKLLRKESTSAKVIKSSILATLPKSPRTLIRSDSRDSTKMVNTPEVDTSTPKPLKTESTSAKVIKSPILATLPKSSRTLIGSNSRDSAKMVNTPEVDTSPPKLLKTESTSAKVIKSPTLATLPKSPKTLIRSNSRDSTKIVNTPEVDTSTPKPLKTESTSAKGIKSSTLATLPKSPRTLIRSDSRDSTKMSNKPEVDTLTPKLLKTESTSAKVIKSSTLATLPKSLKTLIRSDSRDSTKIVNKPEVDTSTPKPLKTESTSAKVIKSPILATIPKSPKTLIRSDSRDSTKIVNLPKVETSTPKLRRLSDIIKTPDKRTTIDSVLQDLTKGIENISLESREETLSPIEKIDITYPNDFESGYAGSSGTMREHEDDFAKNTNKAKSESVEININVRTATHTPVLNKGIQFKTSLPVFQTPKKFNILKTAKSLCSISDSSEKKTTTKSSRWNTLEHIKKAQTLKDEVYTSETLLPGHATLPRRSNSPLPNERDTLERDRFPVNRSGLQARSESMASVYSGAGEGTRCNVTVRGEVQFSLLYNYRLGALEVGVKRCRDLAPIDAKRNRSDPYVKVYLLPDKSKAGKRKTKVKKNTLNPVFEETLSFAQTLASLSSRTLWLSVWHADMFGRNDFLGEVSLPLADVVFDDPAPTWYKLHERTEHFDEQQGTRGDLIVGLKFELHETGAMRGKGTLHVLVKEAKNLVATKPNGLADVFCKSYLLPERGRLAKQKTSVARRTLSPRWEHTFTYRGLKPQDLAARALELSLWDRDRLASNDFMGAVRLSLGTGTYMGAHVNWMDSAGKEVSLWQTMMERPNFWVEGSLPLRPQLIN